MTDEEHAVEEHAAEEHAAEEHAAPDSLTGKLRDLVPGGKGSQGKAKAETDAGPRLPQEHPPTLPKRPTDPPF